MSSDKSNRVGSPRGLLPEAPTDPDVRISRIRLFGPRFRLRDGGGDGCAAVGADTAPAAVSSSPTISMPVASGGSTTFATRRRLGRKLVKRPEVSGDTEIPKVPQQFPLECCPLLANWCMPVRRHQSATPLSARRKPVRGGLLLHHPVSLAGPGPVVGEPQQVEGARPGPNIAVFRRCQRSPVRSPEINQPSLLRVKRQPIFRESLRQHVQDSPRVLLLLEDDDYIIRVADQNRAADKSRGDLPRQTTRQAPRASRCSPGAARSPHPVACRPPGTQLPRPPSRPRSATCR